MAACAAPRGSQFRLMERSKLGYGEEVKRTAEPSAAGLSVTHSKTNHEIASVTKNTPTTLILNSVRLSASCRRLVALRKPVRTRLRRAAEPGPSKRFRFLWSSLIGVKNRSMELRDGRSDQLSSTNIHVDDSTGCAPYLRGALNLVAIHSHHTSSGSRVLRSAVWSASDRGRIGFGVRHSKRDRNRHDAG